MAQFTACRRLTCITVLGALALIFLSDQDLLGHFLEQAYGSLMEVASTFFLALDEGYVSEKALEPVLEDLETLGKRIASLNRSLKINTSKTPFARQAPS